MVTGYPVQNGQHAEVLDLLNPEAVCDPLPSINKLISFGSGGLIHDNFPLICGGTGSPKVCRWVWVGMKILGCPKKFKNETISNLIFSPLANHWAHT